MYRKHFVRFDCPEIEIHAVEFTWKVYRHSTTFVGPVYISLTGESDGLSVELNVKKVSIDRREKINVQIEIYRSIEK